MFRSLFVASILVAGSSAGQDDNDRVLRPDVGLSDQLRQVMNYYDSVLDEMRREHKSELSTVRREHKSELNEMKKECKKTKIRLSNRITKLEFSLSKVFFFCAIQNIDETDNIYLTYFDSKNGMV